MRLCDIHGSSMGETESMPMPRGLQRRGIERRDKMLRVAIQLFLKNGYEKTTTASIAKGAGMAPSSFFAAFESKEALLLILVKSMFSRQFERAGKIEGGSEDPLLLYSIEIALQLCIAEQSKPLRELYVTAYSLPTTSEYIYDSMAERLQRIFSGYMPEAKRKDFYEMDIATAGIMRAYMAKPCDMYFTIEDKLRRFLQSSLTLYCVPKEEQLRITDTVLKMDLRPYAEQIIQKMVEIAEAGLPLVVEEENCKSAM